MDTRDCWYDCGKQSGLCPGACKDGFCCSATKTDLDEGCPIEALNFLKKTTKSTMHHCVKLHCKWFSREKKTDTYLVPDKNDGKSHTTQKPPTQVESPQPGPIHPGCVEPECFRLRDHTQYESRAESDSSSKSGFELPYGNEPIRNIATHEEIGKVFVLITITLFLIRLFNKAF